MSKNGCDILDRINLFITMMNNWTNIVLQANPHDVLSALEIFTIVLMVSSEDITVENSRYRDSKALSVVDRSRPLLNSANLKRLAERVYARTNNIGYRRRGNLTLLNHFPFTSFISDQSE